MAEVLAIVALVMFAAAIAEALIDRIRAGRMPASPKRKNHDD